MATETESVACNSSPEQLPFLPTNGGSVSVSMCGYEMDVSVDQSEMVTLSVPYMDITDTRPIAELEWYSPYGGNHLHHIAEYHIDGSSIVCNHLEVPPPIRGDGVGTHALALIPEIASKHPTEIDSFTIRFGDGETNCSWLEYIGFPRERVQQVESDVSDIPSATVGMVRYEYIPAREEPDPRLRPISLDLFPDLI